MAPPDPDLYFCADDPTCPELLVAGDPFSAQTVAPVELTGYGDPSIEHDPETGTLWLAYSWLEVLVEDETQPDVFDLGVSTHIARSDDGGDTFTFVQEVNLPEVEAHPDTAEMGWSVHEVSSIAREGTDDWQLLWFKYFTPLGPDMTVNQRTEFLFFRSDAASPDAFGAASQIWARGDSTSPSWGAPLNLSDIPEVRDCVAFTEPALFTYGGSTYVAMQCSFAGSIGTPFEPERIALFEEVPGGYRYIATLANGFDAEDFDTDFFGQPDIAVAEDGTILLLVTPTLRDGETLKDGCIVFEFEDFESGLLKRDRRGTLIPRAIITADGNGLGPGLCTYDPNSSTGVLLVIVRTSPDGQDVEFSLRATGIHL